MNFYDLVGSNDLEFRFEPKWIGICFFCVIISNCFEFEKTFQSEIEKNVSGTDNIKVSLKYFDGEPVIKELKRVSTPGRRVYLGADNLPKVRQGLGVAIVSTSKGIMSDAKARQSRVGGEVLCTVF